MPDNVFIAISGDALHAKSKVYVSRALVRKDADDLHRSRTKGAATPDRYLQGQLR